MAEHKTDIVIVGAGIAGLWLFNQLKRLGYDVLLLENKAVGSGQTIASQGIIHSGLKYAFAGKINKLAKNISAMPDLWRAALKGEGPVDLSQARMSAETQHLLVPSGLMGGLVKLITRRVLGGSVREIPAQDWPKEIKESGFRGTVIYMDEPVLEIESVIRALSAPHADSIRTFPSSQSPEFIQSNNKIHINVNSHTIAAQKIIFTSAGSNREIAKELGHDHGLETQARPLLMGFLKPAPFELYAHLVGASEKPVATITTHRCKDGTIVWYLGGGVAERAKDTDASEVIEAVMAGFSKYLPDIDLSGVKWGVWPIDRIEGKSDTEGWMPDTPTIHAAGNCLYCWPTKLTFAPMLSDKIIQRLESENIQPGGHKNNWSFLPEAPITENPWDAVTYAPYTAGKRKQAHE